MTQGTRVEQVPKVVPQSGPERRYTRSRRAVHLSAAERAASGKAARSEVPRSSHAVFDPPAGRPDPVALLEDQAAARVPELVPIRYGRMLTSPFAYFRGSALVMASDLAGTPTSGLRVQACGDAHLSNFGLFASPERQLVFDMNDFDETLPGPWEWDVKRLAASLEVAGRDNGFDDADRRTVVLSGVRSYRTTMSDLAGRGNLASWYAQFPVEDVKARLDAATRKRLVAKTRKIADKARAHDHLRAFGRLVTVADGEPRFVSDPPLLVPIEELLGDAVTGEEMQAALAGAIRTYRNTLTTENRRLLEGYRFVQLARKVVGVGSVGTRAWVALMLGRDAEDPLLLQIKEAQPSVLEAFVGRSEYSNAGHRVVAGQRLMQAASDHLLGWERLQGIDGRVRDFYIRQLHDWKGSFDVQEMVPTGMALYAELCGWTLARAHARSGDRIAIAAYLGNKDVFDRAVATFASLYADQTARDHAALATAVTERRVQAESGV